MKEIQKVHKCLCKKTAKSFHGSSEEGTDRNRAKCWVRHSARISDNPGRYLFSDAEQFIRVFLLYTKLAILAFLYCLNF